MVVTERAGKFGLRAGNPRHPLSARQKDSHFQTPGLKPGLPKVGVCYWPLSGGLVFAFDSEP